jgi:hypothetical protein
MRRLRVNVLFSCFLCAIGSAAFADERKWTVRDNEGLTRALAEVATGPGGRIVIAAGTYRPGVYVRGLRATAAAPVVIEGADPDHPPVFQGGNAAMHFSGCAHLTLRNLLVRGASGNGINIDDGGSFDTPSHHVRLENVRVEDVGPSGNHDGIKLSGVDDLVVTGCTVDGWGGEGVDMVGCHRVLVENCTFRGKPGFGQATGVQAKGGSADVTVRGCTFVNGGGRAVNLGGSTDPRVFRPPGARYEAKNVTVEGCRFSGSLAPVAFVGVDGATVRFNTIYHPTAWAARVLQENTAEGMVPCRGGRFERNLVVFRADQLRTAVNVGPKTEPDSFVFRENFWFCEDRPDHSRPALPTPEHGGVYGVDPKLRILDDGTPSGAAAEAEKAFGADALPQASSDPKP